MLMIAGPRAPEPARKPVRSRRATDAGAGPEAVAKPAAAPRAGRRSTDPKPQPAQAAPEPVASESEPWIGRPFAPLVAQLIAGKLGAAQTRLRRRGTPDEADAAYRAGARRARRHVLETEA